MNRIEVKDLKVGMVTESGEVIKTHITKARATITFRSAEGVIRERKFYYNTDTIDVVSL